MMKMIKKGRDQLMEMERVFDNVSNNKMDDDDDGDDGDNKVVQLPGFRFHPTDEELVGFYLKRKVEKIPISIDHLIKHIDLYKYDPWDLPRVSSGGEREWYFFCKRGRKYRNSVRPNRVTGSGFWKATGIDKPIYSLVGFRDCIGLKKSLVYYRGNAGKCTKTDWMMHEFRLPSATRSTSTSHASNNNAQMIINNNFQEAEVWTLCRIFKREVSYKRNASLLKQSDSIINDTSIAKTAGSLDQLMHRDNSKNMMSCQQVLTAVEPCEAKPVWDQYLYDRNFTFAAGHMSLLTTTQHPIPTAVASHLSFPNIPKGDEWVGEENWDELSPVVDCSRYIPIN